MPKAYIPGRLAAVRFILRRAIYDPRHDPDTADGIALRMALAGTAYTFRRIYQRLPKRDALARREVAKDIRIGRNSARNATTRGLGTHHDPNYDHTN